MNRDWEDDRIRQLFRELRREDEQLAPPFIRHWESVRSQIGAKRRFFMFTTAAAAAAVLILLSASTLIVLHHSMPPPAPPSSWKSAWSIMLWRPPTDFLLQTPGGELLRTVPAIGRSSVQVPALVLERKTR
ncbi:MAG TPA: hypothetical protein VGL91_11360 [Acidobacteriota bacterium]|jgi:hypothetical protein